ncbi:hypothetical protein DWB61_11445 [Ancylomarina euxinus]|uniref:Uncharacterized protein n=1 Tax=Ancylomarina euxinus TaxID=2283627 RepID=A0A425Y092_9BACT|nr:hypothetical protein [Ancylomarina euxinus]MCZ4695333.1 hypothetical protein [Ancylomarina euxinus]MUP15528.1 hypothetical protein [Ancylomarina euxinus]RRG21027.1 hypothetical protein DWB61_11445 [Ancylomarina euxinus]
MTTENIYKNLVEHYNKGITEKDPKIIREFLNEHTHMALKDEPRFFLEILQHRAAAFALFGELNEAGKEYAKGYSSCSTSGKWVYGLNWALQYTAEFSINRGKAKLTEVLSEALPVLEQAEKDLVFDQYREFYQLTLSNVKAFVLMSVGEKEKALAEYKDVNFTPVPIPAYNDKESLQLLFAHYTKGLAVAIEYKDVELLNNLLKVISLDDELLQNEKNLFKLFYETLVSTFDMRAEFITEFNAMFKIKDKIKTVAPSFARFLTLIGEQDFDKLDVFFKDFK